MVYWHTYIFLNRCSFINFTLAHKEILPGNLMSVDCTSHATTINYAWLPVWKVLLKYLTPADTEELKTLVKIQISRTRRYITV